MKEINYEQLVANIDQMVHILEVDASRSAGKMKLNSQHLHSLYWLKENVYKDKVAKAPVKKTTAKAEQ